MELVSYIPYAVLFLTFELMLVCACLERYNVGKDTPVHPMEREQRRMFMERMFFCIQLGLAGLTTGNFWGIWYNENSDCKERNTMMHDIARSHMSLAVVLLLQYLWMKRFWNSNTDVKTEDKSVYDENMATTPLLLV